ncbi:hypothetical protein ACLKA7_007998 [Drosophila subpalustris]
MTARSGRRRVNQTSCSIRHPAIDIVSAQLSFKSKSGSMQKLLVQRFSRERLGFGHSKMQLVSRYRGIEVVSLFPLMCRIRSLTAEPVARIRHCLCSPFKRRVIPIVNI